MKHINAFQRRLKLIFSLTVAFCLLFNIVNSQKTNQWMEYTSVEEAGFTSVGIDSIKAQYDLSGASALMVISDGKVVLSMGDITRRFMVHSIRKSFMNALIGIEIDKGNLSLYATLESMGIEDINPLTDTEKQTTLKDLISARSGIYLPSAYAPQGMIDNLPERGSARPGETWYYNNWDFNVLVTIYNQVTGRDFFNSFKENIAIPLGMEDFRLSDVYYRLEEDRSMHPAYLFNMSARDMARFGQLFLNDGKWKNKQLIPSSWVDESTSIISDDLGRFAERGGYGYLWWVSKTSQGKKMYYASGSGGHRIVILPEDNMVIVTRANTYENRMIKGISLEKIIESIVDAKVGSAVKNPYLKPYNPETVTIENPYKGSMDHYLGKYQHPALGVMEILDAEDGYLLKTNVGSFNLWAVDKDRFYPEDLEVNVRMVKTDDESKRRKIDMTFNPNRTIKEAIFYY